MSIVWLLLLLSAVICVIHNTESCNSKVQEYFRNLREEAVEVETKRDKDLRKIAAMAKWSNHVRTQCTSELERRIKRGSIPEKEARYLINILDKKGVASSMFNDFVIDKVTLSYHAILLMDTRNALFPETITQDRRPNVKSHQSGSLDFLMKKMQKRVNETLKEAGYDKEELEAILYDWDREVVTGEDATNKILLQGLIDHEVFAIHDEIHSFDNQIDNEEFEARLEYCKIPKDMRRRGLNYLCDLMNLEKKLDFLRVPNDSAAWVRNYGNSSFAAARRPLWAVTAAVSIISLIVFALALIVGAANDSIRLARETEDRRQSAQLLSFQTTPAPPMPIELRPTLGPDDPLLHSLVSRVRNATNPLFSFKNLTEERIQELHLIELFWIHSFAGQMMVVHKQSVMNWRVPGSFCVDTSKFVHKLYFINLLRYFLKITSVVIKRSYPWVYYVNYRAPTITADYNKICGWVGHPYPHYTMQFRDLTGVLRHDYELSSIIPGWLWKNGTDLDDPQYFDVKHTASMTLPEGDAVDFLTSMDPSAKMKDIFSREQMDTFRNRIDSEWSDCTQYHCDVELSLFNSP